MQAKLLSILARLSLSLLLATSFALSAAVPRQSRSLSFADRVAYQRAIENVYWHYRIWPKERPEPKPSLDTVMSQAELEKKVTEYLHNSAARENQWQQPITADQLQAEMDRMAEHTKQPGVLRELFVALNNDPFVIAECLARPVLAERLATTNSYAHDQQGFESWSAKQTRGQMPQVIAAGNTNYMLPAISGQPGECDDSWTSTSATNSPSGRVLHAAVWTGSEMIVWGGESGGGGTFPNTGSRYNPSTDTWTATSTINAPEGRWFFTGVWTGTEMIVWGGFDGSSFTLNTGGRYNPGTNSWTATSTTNAPEGRSSHTAVWTGSEMIVWGGGVSSGGRYNPDTDSWTATTTTNAPSPRAHHTAVWTGSEMIVWGGYFFDGTNNYFNTGGKYNPSTDSWITTTTTNAPSGRDYHTAVWTGSEMIVWGGTDINHELNTGGRYNPGTDSWTVASTTNAPSARSDHTAVWTGSEMIIWGGGLGATNSGGRYNPGADSWTATSTINAPSSRLKHTAVWTGSDMIVWGGYPGSGRPVDTGGRYCARAGESITLDARVVRQGGIRIVVLSWSPADGGSVSVLRNGVVVATTDDDGTVKDKLGTQAGTFTYQVCETDSGDCSNEVTVRIRGAAD